MTRASSSTTLPVPQHSHAPSRARVQELLDVADVWIDGIRPTDLRVHDERLYTRVITHGSLGFGEAYMDGWWDADDLDGLFYRLMKAHIDERVGGVDDAALFLRAKLLNMQRGRRAYRVGQLHYDLGNDLFRAMLGKRLVYSCGYWKDADNLDDAQEAKLDLICRKLGLQPGMRVLDIGCGWGEALKFAAERYGVSGVGVTISQEQADFATELCKGLPVEIRVQDYRELDEKFDRVFSIGMFEHVGVKNYRTYFEVNRRCLRDERPRVASLHRRQQDHEPYRSVDRQIYLPQFDVAFRQPDHRCPRRPVRDRGLAQLRRLLRSDADGVAQELRRRLAATPGKIRRTFLPHVAILSIGVGGGVPFAPRPVVAARAQSARRARRLYRAALIASIRRSSIYVTVSAP